MEPFNNKVQRKSEVNIKQSAEDNWRKRDPMKESDTDSAILVKKAKLTQANDTNQQIFVLKSSHALKKANVNTFEDDACSSVNPVSPLNRMIESLIPVHKNIIIGRKFIAVDYFTASDLCKYHFLTHAHPDRLIHLNSKWEEPIYCSELTAKIIPIVMGKDNGVNLELLRPLKVGCTHTIDCNLKVTVLDANHCPGSVMFLFEGVNVPGGAVLCTGDFRADSQMMELFERDEAFHRLANTCIDNIYFDNTYLSYPQKTFLERKESVTRLISEIEKILTFQCVVLIPTYNLGREEAIESLSEKIGEVISMNYCRLQVNEVLPRKNRDGVGVAPQFCDESEGMVRIRTVPRNIRLILKAIRKAKDPVVIIDLSLQNDLSSYNYPKTVKFIQIPYSDHSSNKEIERFLDRLSFHRIIPIYESLCKYSSKSFIERESAQDNCKTPSLEQYITNALFMQSSYLAPSLTHDWVIDGVDLSAFAPMEISILPSNINSFHVEIVTGDLSQRISC